MSQKPDSANERRSVLDLLGTKHGTVSKVLLPDSGSEHGGSPIVAPGSAHTKVIPSGRDKYRIVGEIARGGMGVILKGHDRDLGRDIADLLGHGVADAHPGLSWPVQPVNAAMVLVVDAIRARRADARRARQK